MSEKVTTPERQEVSPTPETHEALTAHTVEKPHKPEKDPSLAAREAREAVSETVRSDTQPNALDKLKQAESVPREPLPTQVNRELKQITLRRELKNIRRQLPRRQRVLSKLIHRPAVRAASEAAGKTVTRPSGLLGGGLVALLGTSAYLYLAHHRGFRYNFGVFFLLFAGGFAVGLILELLVHLATRSRRRLED